LFSHTNLKVAKSLLERAVVTSLPGVRVNDLTKRKTFRKIPSFCARAQSLEMPSSVWRSSRLGCPSVLRRGEQWLRWSPNTQMKCH